MKLFISFFLCAFLSMQMSAQLTSAWTTNISTKNLPTHANIPTVAKLTSPVYQPFDITVPGTLDNANDSTAVAAIGAAVRTKLNTFYVVPIWRIDTTAGVIGRILISEIRRGYDTFTVGDLANQYKVAVDVFRVKGIYQYVAD
ncbi:MAG TPA: hypothetical protein VFG10_18960 [Saprospiraceae bacterium]|nr:hypothetical protein [Saprospiraceae bacterium]